MCIRDIMRHCRVQNKIGDIESHLPRVQFLQLKFTPLHLENKFDFPVSA